MTGRPVRFERFMRMVLWPPPAADPELEPDEPWAIDPGPWEAAPFTTTDEGDR